MTDGAEATPNKFSARAMPGGAKGAAGGFAVQRVAAGETICTLTGETITREEMKRRVASGAERTGDDPLEIGPGLFMDLHAPFLCFNHSCAPNAAMRGVSDLVALRAIAPGEEITFDYSTNVSAANGWVMGADCACGSWKCRWEIGNVATIARGELRRYYERGLLQDHIRREVPALLATREPPARRIIRLVRRLPGVRPARRAWLRRLRWARRAR